MWHILQNWQANKPTHHFKCNVFACACVCVCVCVRLYDSHSSIVRTHRALDGYVRLINIRIMLLINSLRTGATIYSILERTRVQQIYKIVHRKQEHKKQNADYIPSIHLCERHT